MDPTFSKPWPGCKGWGKSAFTDFTTEGETPGVLIAAGVEAQTRLDLKLTQYELVCPTFLSLYHKSRVVRLITFGLLGQQNDFWNLIIKIIFPALQRWTIKRLAHSTVLLYCKTWLATTLSYDVLFRWSIRNALFSLFLIYALMI